MAKHFSKAERKEIENRLLKNGRKLFLAKGIRATSVDILCESAEITRGTFYSFYESKYDMFLAIVEIRQKLAYDQIISFTDSFIGNSSDYVGQIFDQIHEMHRSDPILGVASRPHEFEKFIQKIPKKRWDEYWENGRTQCHLPLAKCAADNKLIRQSSGDLLQELAALLGQIATRRTVLHEKRYLTHIGHLRDMFIIKLALDGDKA